MGRNLCCKKRVIRRSPWTVLEDNILKSFIKAHGERKWNSVPTSAGLNRCGKSCRLRWLNYLRPNIKRGNISPEEDDLIIRLHNLLGNRWALIAARLPGRTDNEIKNYWNTTLVKKATSGRAEAAVSTTYTAPMQTQMAVRTKAKNQQAPVLDSPPRLLRPPCPADDDSIISSQVVLTPLSSTYPMKHDRSDHLLPVTIDPQVNAGLDSPNPVIVLEDRLGIKNTTLDDCQGSNFLNFEPITFEEYWIASCCDVDHHI